MNTAIDIVKDGFDAASLDIDLALFDWDVIGTVGEHLQHCLVHSVTTHFSSKY